MLQRTLTAACLWGLAAACHPSDSVTSGPANPKHVVSSIGGIEVIELEDFIAQDTTRPPWVKASTPPPASPIPEAQKTCGSGKVWLPGDWHYQDEKWKWATGHCFIGGYSVNEPSEPYLTITEPDGDKLNLNFNRGLYKDGMYQRSFWGRSKRGSDKDEGQMNILGRGK